MWWNTWGDTRTKLPLAITRQDYYPFGMLMDGRGITGADGYRYVQECNTINKQCSIRK
jgi:hypothetical protein